MFLLKRLKVERMQQINAPKSLYEEIKGNYNEALTIIRELKDKISKKEEVRD